MNELPREYPKKLLVGKTGDYTYTVSNKWLSPSTLSSVDVTVIENGITVSNVTYAGNIIRFFVTGVTRGVRYVKVSFNTTDGRSDGEVLAIVVDKS